ncbi:MAG TPA: hypothetical protein VFT88_11105 [Acidobacteriaceae bacterium]|nr:hypothetical protein [Acidobacteriaceae bacterium]
MTSILEHVAKSHHSSFRPYSPEDYFVLSLARRLKDQPASQHYRILASQYPRSALLKACRKAITTNPDRAARVFHEILESLDARPQHLAPPQPRAMAIRVERRSVAVVLFAGTHLEGWRVRQLSSDARHAQECCVGFIRDVLDEHGCDDVALEAASGETISTKLHRALATECRARGIAVAEIPKQLVIESFAYPSPGTRSEVREIVARMWSVPNIKSGRNFVFDAAALGLYIQTRRLFDGT